MTALSLSERLATSTRRHPNGCLEWVLFRTKRRGYGQMRVGGRGGVTVYAHRIAWALAHPGEQVPPVVRHRCDNPPCCDPEHLLGGTIADNNQDMVDRGRARGGQPPGDHHPQAKLTQDQIRAMREAYQQGGVTQQTLANQYGVSFGYVSQIVRGEKRVGV